MYGVKTRMVSPGDMPIRFGKIWTRLDSREGKRAVHVSDGDVSPPSETAPLKVREVLAVRI